MRAREFFFISFILIFTFSLIAMLYLYGKARMRGTFLVPFGFALVFSVVATLVCTTIYGLYNMMKKRKKSRARTRMYRKGSEECLLNAKQLIEDGRLLIEKGSFGTAQSLCLTAFEEVGKALILELANLGFVSRDVVSRAMRDHRPKRVILIGIEKSTLLLGQNLASQASQYILDRTRLEKLTYEMRKDIGRLGKKRQSGFYVQVNPEDGRITSSPRRSSFQDAQSTINKAEVFLRVGEVLCKFFRGIEEIPRTDVRLRRVILPKSNEPDYTITIVWDEI